MDLIAICLDYRLTPISTTHTTQKPCTEALLSDANFGLNLSAINYCQSTSDAKLALTLSEPLSELLSQTDRIESKQLLGVISLN